MMGDGKSIDERVQGIKKGFYERLKVSFTY